MEKGELSAQGFTLFYQERPREENLIAMNSKNSYTVEKYTDIVGGSSEMCGKVHDGDVLIAETPPGCWGPMITPHLKSGHEVTCPVEVAGTEPGDTVALFVERIEVLSDYAASGTGRKIPENFDKDPSLHAKCPSCGTYYPKTVLKGIGPEAVKCSECGQSIIPQDIANGYTVAIDDATKIAVSLPAEMAQEAARKTERGEVYLPHGSQQNLATILAKSDIEDMIIRSCPMIGNIGCSPAKAMPSSKNSGDLIDSLNKTRLFETVTVSDITDAHMDINTVSEGCVILSPVKIKGAGIFLGDVHLTQGNGELAGHTLDISARVTLRVKVIKGLALEGPVIIPRADLVDKRFQPFSEAEYTTATVLLQKEPGQMEKRFPVQVVGTGQNLNLAIESAVERAAKLTGLPADEIKNLATVCGEVSIGRTSGTVFLTLLLTKTVLEKNGLWEMVKQQFCK
jgi:acetamidase/formamidase